MGHLPPPPPATFAWMTAWTVVVVATDEAARWTYEGSEKAANGQGKAAKGSEWSRKGSEVRTCVTTGTCCQSPRRVT